ncbi:MAG: bifunctional glutamate N-acetyltransferase/amino-acid acetyltransferase ArgJ [Gammaproteobacteria bacterium]|nr:bifunctional glutamate N-acetyltransferase/amino-acid acetyltransferase ArgJ [Gammaproteobacteria bacterium]
MAVGEGFQGGIYPVAGIRLAAVASHIRYANRLDLVLIELNKQATTAGVFTQNRFCAPPVTLAKRHLATSPSRFFLINTGNANAGTGANGLAAAKRCCEGLAALANVSIESVLPFSTGVIGEPLPVEKLLLGLPNAFAELSTSNWQAAARGIMTTDTRPKLVSERIQINGENVTITGFAKGAGMLKPNMATMLSYVFTDAVIAGPRLHELLKAAVNRSFNRLTIDGDTSTNDSCMLVATGCSNLVIEEADVTGMQQFADALNKVFQTLAIDVVKDAEGASKFITIEVIQGKDSEECLRVAYAIAESPLVKTAFFASDPNWGRILAAIGRSGISDLDIDKVAVYLGSSQIVANGCRFAGYTEAQGKSVMVKSEITVRVELARGSSAETVWTSDLSYDYVRINADYRS